MDVILDTNILRNDVKMNSKLWLALVSFLNKTDSKIILPNVVFEEAVSLYKRDYISLISKTNDLIKKLNYISFNKSKISEIEVDLDKDIDEYKKLIMHPYTLSKTLIIKNKYTHLNEAVTRLLNAQKPASNKRNEYRDVLIWLSVRDYLVKNKTSKISFISNNTREFSDDKNNLCLQLSEELKDLKINLDYYPSLEEFLKSKAIKIEFINEKWIEENIDYGKLFDRIIDMLEDNDELRNFIERSEDSFTGYYNLQSTDSFNSSIDEYFVLDMDDQNIYLHINLYFSFEIDIELRESIYDWDTAFWDSGLKDSKRNTKYKTKNIDLSVYLSATIHNKKIKDIDIDDWYIN